MALFARTALEIVGRRGQRALAVIGHGVSLILTFAAQGGCGTCDEGTNSATLLRLLHFCECPGVDPTASVDSLVVVHRSSNPNDQSKDII